MKVKYVSTVFNPYLCSAYSGLRNSVKNLLQAWNEGEHLEEGILALLNFAKINTYLQIYPNGLVLFISKLRRIWLDKISK